MTSTTTIVTRDAFLQAAKRRYADVTIREFGTVRIQSMTAGEQARIAAASFESNEKKRADKLSQVQALYIATCLVDEQNARIFSDNEVEHVLRMDARIAAKIYDAISKHCGLEDDDEELEKN